MKIPDPYARTEFRGRPLDYATAAACVLIERELGYQLTILQGIGGAPASAGTHLGLNGEGGRAVDLAPWGRGCGAVAACRDERRWRSCRCWRWHARRFSKDGATGGRLRGLLSPLLVKVYPNRYSWPGRANVGHERTT